MARVLVVVCWLAVLSGVPAVAAQPELSVVLSNQEYPPYMGQKLAGYGLMSSVVTAAFRQQQVKVRYVFYPNNRTLQSARSGVVDGSLGWALTEERKRDLLFSEPVMSLKMVFVQRADERIAWNALPDLAPYRIGVTVGNTYSSLFSRLQNDKVLNVEVAPDDLSNLRKLLANHIDLFPIDAEVGAMMLSQSFPPAQQRQLRVQDRAFWMADMRVVIWRHHPHATELVRRFNLGLQQLRASGEYARLVAQNRRDIQEGRERHALTRRRPAASDPGALH